MRTVWLKVFASSLVVAGMASIGFTVARSLRRRPAELQALQTALRMLETEVDYGATPLPRALERVSRSVPGTAGRLFALAAAHLAQSRGEGAGEAWARALMGVYPETCWRRSDLDILMALGPYLGASHREDQLRHLRLALERLAAAERDACRDALQQARLAQYLGVLGGLLLALLAG